MERSDSNTSIQDLKASVQKFISDREWEKYHSPRNLAESICIESAELLELFQWSNAGQEPVAAANPISSKKIEEELADIIIYSLSMTNALGIDISNAVLEKLERNARKYPVERCRGVYIKP